MRAGIEHHTFWDSEDRTSGLFGGWAAQWLGENKEGTVVTGNLRELNLSAEKLAGFTEVTREQIEDAPGSEETFSGGLEMLLSMTLDEAFLVGDGVGKPHGALNESSRVIVTRGGANAITWADVVGMWTRMHPAMHGRAVWVANVETAGQLFTMVDGNNNYIWPPSVSQGVAGDAPTTLLGRPLYFVDTVPALGSEGDLALIYWPGYMVGMRNGISLDRSNAPGWTRDVISLRAIVRADGNSIFDQAITPRNGSNTLSWCVVLSG
jgi:HK97 family phage major capsid protein